MPLTVHTLLDLPVYRALDIDDAGRVLCVSDESGSLQLAEIGTDGRLTPLTALGGACTGRYLPGRRTVVVSHDDGGNERAQLSLLNLDADRTVPAGLDDLTPLVRDPRYIHALAEVAAERVCYVTNRRDGVQFDVVVRSLATGDETVVFRDAGMQVRVTLSPDGRSMAFAVPGRLPMSYQLLVVDLAAAEDAPDRVRALTGPDEATYIARYDWTADGAALIVTANRDRDLCAIARVDVASGGWTWLVADDRHDLVGWPSPDGTALLVEANVDGASRLALHDAATGTRIRAIALPRTGQVASPMFADPRWSPDSRTIVASFTAPGVPGDVLRIDAAAGTSQALTASTAPLAGAVLAEPAVHRIPTPDGERIPCLVYPAADDADPGLRGTAVVLIHGGPEGQSRIAFNAQIQAMSQAGHTVLVPNVRGSVGYGKRWYSLDDVRLRLDSVADLAAVRAYAAGELGLDADRLALWGGSYGGYMVLAGLAFQPDLWAAGVDIVGMSSLVTFLENTSAYRRSLREREYGSLAADREFLVEASPLTRVDDIRAPLFVIHGANDPRVPVTEARQLHAALTANKVDCDLVVYPDEGHGLAKRANRLDAYPRALEFLGRHLAR